MKIASAAAPIAVAGTPGSTSSFDRCSRLSLALLNTISLVAAVGVPCVAHSAPNCVSDSIEVHVDFTPGVPVINETKASRELQKTGAYAMVHQLGLTLANSQRTVAVRVPEQAQCVRPIVRVQLTVQPLVIELASELSAMPCLREHVLRHEMQHAATYNAASARAAVQLEREMQRQLRLPPVPRDSDLLRQVHAQVNGYWLARLDALLAQENAEQQAIDAPEPGDAYRACAAETARFIRIAR